MPVQAVLFGSIGTLVETSEIQRRAFNLAFAAHGLDWEWDQTLYARMLQSSGGAARIAAHAQEVGVDVDADMLHATKVALFTKALGMKGLSPRDGVVEVMSAATSAGIPVGLASSTGSAQSAAVIDATGGAISAQDFAFIGDSGMVESGKPAPDIYHAALDALGVAAADVIAIEDSPTSAAAALAAGVTTFATPGALHAGHAFPDGAIMIKALTPDILGGRMEAAQ